MEYRATGVKTQIRSEALAIDKANGRFYINKGQDFIYQVACTISRSGAAQSKKLHRYVLSMYNIDPTTETLALFSKIYARPPHTTLREKAEIKEEYNFSRDSLMALFKTAKELKKVDKAYRVFAPGNLMAIRSVVNNMNNAVRDLCMTHELGDGVILSADGLLESIGLDIWKEDFISSRIRAITRDSSVLWDKNMDKIRRIDHDAIMDEWDEWEDGCYGMGCFY